MDKLILRLYIPKDIYKVNVFSLCKCFLECSDEILAFTNFTSLLLISRMIALMVILFTIKLYARNNPLKKFYFAFHFFVFT